MYLWCCQSRNERKLLYVTGGVGKRGGGESRGGWDRGNYIMFYYQM